MEACEEDRNANSVNQFRRPSVSICFRRTCEQTASRQVVLQPLVKSQTGEETRLPAHRFMGNLRDTEHDSVGAERTCEHMRR